MMRKVLLLILVLIGGYSYGQVYQQMSQYGVEFKRMDNDSVLRIPRGLGSLRSISGYDTAQIRYNVSDSSVYVHTGNGWIKVVRSESSVDSSIFATRYYVDTAKATIRTSINTKLNASDTTSLSNRINLKLNISDTVNIRPQLVAGSNVTITGTYPILTIESLGGGSTFVDSAVQIGTVYSKNSWANLNDFTDVGTSASISGTAISISGGSNNLTQFLAIKDTVLYNSWKHKVRFKINATPSGTTYGIGIGLNSVISAAASSAIIKADLSTGANGGKLLMYDGSNNLTTLINGSAISFALDDTLEISIEKADNLLYAEMINLNDSSNKYSISYAITLPTQQVPATGRFAIYRFGGDYLVNNISVSSNDRKYAPIAFIGDSKTQIYSATEFTKSYVGLSDTYLKNGSTNIPSVINFGCNGGETKDVLAIINTILNAKPKIAVMAIGSNDKRNGKTNAQWFTNYKAITNQLIAAGITVRHLLPFPETSQNLSDYVDSIVTTYPTTYIDTWNPLRSGTNLAAAYSYDGIHFNDLGHSVVFRQLVKSGLLDSFQLKKSIENIDLPITLGGGNLKSNIAIGQQSLFSNVVGVGNIGIGIRALQKNRATGNIGIGFEALKNDTTGQRNIAIGYLAAPSLSSASSSNIVGYGAAYSLTTGGDNNAVGDNALYATTTTTKNSAFGTQSLYANTGTENSGYGYYSLKANTSGNYNTGVGSQALLTNATGSYNTGVGFSAVKTTTASYNTGLGYGALFLTSSGANNLALGNQSGVYNTTASNQIFVNTIDRSNYSGDTLYSPIYVKQSTTNSDAGMKTQITYLNGVIKINRGVSTNAVIEASSPSNSQGVKFPNMTTTQRDAVTWSATNDKGMTIFNTTTGKLEVWDGSTWNAAW